MNTRQATTTSSPDAALEIARASFHCVTDVRALLSQCGGDQERVARLVKACDRAGLNANAVFNLAKKLCHSRPAARVERRGKHE